MPISNGCGGSSNPVRQRERPPHSSRFATGGQFGLWQSASPCFSPATLSAEASADTRRIRFPQRNSFSSPLQRVFTSFQLGRLINDAWPTGERSMVSRRYLSKHFRENRSN